MIRFVNFCYTLIMTSTFKSIALSALLFAGVTASVGAHAGAADFTLVNRTGYSISEVYISAANKDAWGKDRMGDGTLDNSKAKLFRFSDAANCVQDIKVVFEDDGSEVVWEDIDLCEVHKITLRYNRKTRVVSAETE